MFRRRPQNPLRGLIFTDGTIDHVRQVGDDLVLDFTDHGGVAVQVRLRGVSSQRISEDALRYGVMAAELSGTEERWTVCLTDDDGEPLFEATYADAEIVVAAKAPVP